MNIGQLVQKLKEGDTCTKQGDLIRKESKLKMQAILNVKITVE
jgi:hypothetical protein